MTHLDFVLWMTLFPVCANLMEYIDHKCKIMEGKTPEGASNKVQNFIGWMWLIVGLYLLIL